MRVSIGAVAGGVIAAVLAVWSVPAGAAAPGAKFKFSGGEAGTLSVPSCTINALGSQFDLHGKLSHKNAAWLLTVGVAKPGTYTHFVPSSLNGGTYISLEQNGRIWVAKKGTLTMGPSSGSLNVTMKPYTPGAGSKSIKVAGTWNGCSGGFTSSS